jgi:hypothetical protein
MTVSVVSSGGIALGPQSRRAQQSRAKPAVWPVARRATLDSEHAVVGLIGQARPLWALVRACTRLTGRPSAHAPRPTRTPSGTAAAPPVRPRKSPSASDPASARGETLEAAITSCRPAPSSAPRRSRGSSRSPAGYARASPTPRARWFVSVATYDLRRNHRPSQYECVTIQQFQGKAEGVGNHNQCGSDRKLRACSTGVRKRNNCHRALRAASSRCHGTPPNLL